MLAANPEADDLPPPRQAQRIDALAGLGKDQEAVEQARRLVRATNGSDRSLLILAHLLQKTNPDAAYSAISAVSGGPALEAYRAQLLQERGDADSAAQVYEDLLRSSGDRDLRAWGGLARISAARNRDWDFIERASAVVESPPPGFPPAGVAQLRLLRGQAEEHTGSYDAAIEDYRGVLAVLPKSVVALNNLAWLLGTRASGGPDTQTAQRREALDLATQAVALAPTVAQIHHTRAKILQTLGQNDDALAAYDQAAARVEALQKSEPAGARSAKDELASRHGRYLIDKSALLESMGRVDDARALYETIRTQDAGTTAAREAAAALARLGS